MSNTAIDLGMILKRHFDPTLNMLEQCIDVCPEDVWIGEGESVPFWQQIFHAITGIEFWYRKAGEKFELPTFNKDVTPDLALKSSAYLTKEELKDYTQQMREKSDGFFDHVSTKLDEPSEIYDKLLHVDIILMQIRHIQHHIGYCNHILKEHGAETVQWTGFEES